MDNPVEKIKRKLAKLKNLYEGAKKVNNEAEAAAAASAIQRLLAEYNLSMSEIGSVDENQKDKVLHEYSKCEGRWELHLTNVICKWNFCSCYMVNNTYKRIVVVGESQNIETVRWLVKMLKERFISFAKMRYKEYKKEIPEWRVSIPRDKFIRDYLSGAASGLDAKLREEHEREKKEEAELSARINALVVCKKEAVDMYVKNTWGGANKARTYTFDSNEARAKGYSDGKNTSINKSIAGGRTAVDKTKLLV